MTPDPAGRAALGGRLTPRLLLVAGTIAYTIPLSVGFVWEPDSAVRLAVTLGLTLPWLVGGSRPRTCFALMAATAVLQLALDIALQPANLMMFAAVHAVADRRPRRESLVAAGLVVAGALAAALRWGDVFSSAAVPFLAAVGGTVAAWTLGYNAALRRAYALSLARRAAQLEREREHLAQLAAAHERGRIARDLHDVISHSLAGVLTLAEGLSRAPDLRVDHREGLGLIGSSCRSALAELRRLLRVLHDDDEPETQSLTVGHLPVLLLPLQVRGVETRFDASPRIENLPEGVQVAFYRIAQEALTNVHKHGTDVTTVTVSLRWDDHCAVLTVDDDGSAGSARTSGGFGLQGMAERAQILDGSLEAGPRVGRGFRVRVRVPVVAVGCAPTPDHARRDVEPVTVPPLGDRS